MHKAPWLSAPLILAGLLRNQRLRQDELVALQNRKLRRLIKHSFENVQYYNRLFRESGIRPEDIRTVSDLEKIPISKKSDLCGLPLSEISVSNVSLVHNNLAGTSGSSGVKLQFYREKRELLTSGFLRCSQPIKKRIENLQALLLQLQSEHASIKCQKQWTLYFWVWGLNFNPTNQPTFRPVNARQKAR